jgi:hypothetical protein
MLASSTQAEDPGDQRQDRFCSLDVNFDFTRHASRRDRNRPDVPRRTFAKTAAQRRRERAERSAKHRCQGGKSFSREAGQPGVEDAEERIVVIKDFAPFS